MTSAVAVVSFYKEGNGNFVRFLDEDLFVDGNLDGNWIRLGNGNYLVDGNGNMVRNLNVNGVWYNFWNRNASVDGIGDRFVDGNRYRYSNDMRDGIRLGNVDHLRNVNDVWHSPNHGHLNWNWIRMGYMDGMWYRDDFMYGIRSGHYRDVELEFPC